MPDAAVTPGVVSAVLWAADTCGDWSLQQQQQQQCWGS